MQVSERRKTTISQELEKNGLQPTDDAVNSVAAIMGAKGINYQLAVKQFVAKCHSKVAGPAAPHVPPTNELQQNAIANHAAALSSDESALNSFVDQISSHLGQPIGDRIAATSLLKGAKLGDAILSGNAEPGELTKAAMAMVFGEIAAIGTALNSWEQFNLPKSYCLPQPLPMLALNGSNPESESYLD